MGQSKIQPSKQNAPKSDKRQHVEPKTGYGFRWFYLLFPFLPSWLIIKAFALLFWHLASSFFVHDDSPFAAFYLEDRSNRIAFLLLVLFLICLFVYANIFM